MIFSLLKLIIRITTFLFSIGLLISYFSSYVSPTSIWYIQLFGLAYPLLLVGTIVLTILNFLIRRKFIFSLFILLAGFFTHVKYFGISTNKASSKTIGSIDEQLTLMSFNVKLFDVYQLVEPALENSKLAFKNFLKENQVDVISFQEYAEDPTNNLIISPEAIKEHGGYDYHVSNLTLEANRLKVGQAIFSKYPIIASGTIDNSEANFPSLFADIVKDKDTIRVYNFHLQSIRFQKDEYSLFDLTIESKKDYTQRITGLLKKLKKAYPSRTHQVERIIAHALTSPYTTILMGDLNDPPTSYAYAQIEAHFSDAFQVGSFNATRTYAGKVPAGRIDYIFYDNQLVPLSFKTYKEKVLSDHYPIQASFALLNKEQSKIK
ncbi:hypothetical protein CW751_10775 [Brumimicrobium salinarum]|uniref:Endonuclease/exonuclease/phosphatase domain-containing protein n=1 Tax=Brumimicrobium salinarum TaxID=2058658 RepID=A0A2I0R179_9FLAO|nr:endonuclease/exonuclease/phosphatase family protein [Brumimicrobium salinarum]PKR80327.1 hypothetical protein CW751_10775 [Brumimicrobium salinarum]